MSTPLRLDADFLTKCESEYSIDLNPYIFDTIEFLRTEYPNPIAINSEDDLVKTFSDLANDLRRIHIMNEALRVGKQPNYTQGRNFKFDLDEVAIIIHAFIPIVQLVLTENNKKYELATYQHTGPRQGTYQFDTRLIETIIYTFNQTTTKIATNYNPNAQLVTIHNDEDGTDWDVESWLKDLSGGLINKFDQDTNTLFWQIIASAINPKQVNAKAIFFYSSVGNNGKGTYGQLLKNLVGKENYSSLPIPAFKHEYMKEQLLGKTLNIADENPVDIYLDSVQDFKAVITGDDILINRKFEKPIAVQIKAINIQMLNGLPKTKDKSDSFYRRIIIVPFVYSFTNNGERAYIKKDYIHRPEILEYVLKRALEMKPFTEFITPKASIKALAQYKEDNNSAVEFWNEFESQFSWDVLPPNFLYALYLAWYQDEHGGDKKSAFSKKVFLQHIQNHLQQNPNWDFLATRETCPNPFYLGSAMDADEPLITKYNLVSYMDPSYKGTDDQLKRTFPRPRTARGIVRL